MYPTSLKCRKTICFFPGFRENVRSKFTYEENYLIGNGLRWFNRAALGGHHQRSE